MPYPLSKRKSFRVAVSVAALARLMVRILKVYGELIIGKLQEN